jgi:sensor histidine kinase YesM
VSISARIHEGRLQVRVEDNGPGFDRYPGPDSSAESSNGGYGLKNVQDRLRAHYGLDAKLQFSRDATDQMTVVSFEIPAVIDSEASE